MGKIPTFSCFCLCLGSVPESLNMPTIIMIVIKVMMVVMMNDDGGDDVNVDFDDLVVGDLVRNVIARLFYVSAVESSFVR